MHGLPCCASELCVQAARLSTRSFTGNGRGWACALPVITSGVHAGDEAEPLKKPQGEEEEQQIIMLPSTRRRSHARRKKALARAQVRECRAGPLSSRRSRTQPRRAVCSCWGEQRSHTLRKGAQAGVQVEESRCRSLSSLLKADNEP